MRLLFHQPARSVPPWQSVQPSTTCDAACIGSMPLWDSLHPTLFAVASACVWSIQLRGGALAGRVIRTSGEIDVGGRLCAATAAAIATKQPKPARQKSAWDNTKDKELRRRQGRLLLEFLLRRQQVEAAEAGTGFRWLPVDLDARAAPFELWQIRARRGSDEEQRREEKKVPVATPGAGKRRPHFGASMPERQPLMQVNCALSDGREALRHVRLAHGASRS